MCVSQTGNRIKLIDFGLAQYYDGSSNLLFMAGTPEFVAPEVIKFEPIDFHTDMWSIGVITYILLSGISPFLGETLGETYCAVEKGEWEFDEEAFEGISEAAKNFISRLLVYDQKKRMLPNECLRHEWIVNSRARATNDMLLNQPNIGKPISKESLKSYLKNKRFRKATWALVFLIRFKKYGLMSWRNSAKKQLQSSIAAANEPGTSSSSSSLQTTLHIAASESTLAASVSAPSASTSAIALASTSISASVKAASVAVVTAAAVLPLLPAEAPPPPPTTTTTSSTDVAAIVVNGGDQVAATAAAAGPSSSRMVSAAIESGSDTVMETVKTAKTITKRTKQRRDNDEIENQTPGKVSSSPSTTTAKSPKKVKASQGSGETPEKRAKVVDTVAAKPPAPMATAKISTDALGSDDGSSSSSKVAANEQQQHHFRRDDDWQTASAIHRNRPSLTTTTTTTTTPTATATAITTSSSTSNTSISSSSINSSSITSSAINRKANSVATILSKFAEKSQQSNGPLSKPLERRSSRAGRTLRDVERPLKKMSSVILDDLPPPTHPPPPPPPPLSPIQPSPVTPLSLPLPLTTSPLSLSLTQPLTDQAAATLTMQEEYNEPKQSDSSKFGGKTINNSLSSLSYTTTPITLALSSADDQSNSNATQQQQQQQQTSPSPSPSMRMAAIGRRKIGGAAMMNVNDQTAIIDINSHMQEQQEQLLEQHYDNAAAHTATLTTNESTAAKCVATVAADRNRNDNDNDNDNAQQPRKTITKKTKRTIKDDQCKKPLHGTAADVVDDSEAKLLYGGTTVQMVLQASKDEKHRAEKALLLNPLVVVDRLEQYPILEEPENIMEEQEQSINTKPSGPTNNSIGETNPVDQLTSPVQAQSSPSKSKPKLLKKQQRIEEPAKPKSKSKTTTANAKDLSSSRISGFRSAALEAEMQKFKTGSALTTSLLSVNIDSEAAHLLKPSHRRTISNPINQIEEQVRQIQMDSMDKSQEEMLSPGIPLSKLNGCSFATKSLIDLSPIGYSDENSPEPIKSLESTKSLEPTKSPSTKDHTKNSGHIGKAKLKLVSADKQPSNVVCDNNNNDQRFIGTEKPAQRLDKSPIRKQPEKESPLQTIPVTEGVSGSEKSHPETSTSAEEPKVVFQRRESKRKSGKKTKSSTTTTSAHHQSSNDIAAGAATTSIGQECKTTTKSSSEAKKLLDSSVTSPSNLDHQTPEKSPKYESGSGSGNGSDSPHKRGGVGEKKITSKDHDKPNAKSALKVSPGEHTSPSINESSTEIEDISNTGHSPSSQQQSKKSIKPKLNWHSKMLKVFDEDEQDEQENLRIVDEMVSNKPQLQSQRSNTTMKSVSPSLLPPSPPTVSMSSALANEVSENGAQQLNHSFPLAKSSSTPRKAGQKPELNDGQRSMGQANNMKYDEEYRPSGYLEKQQVKRKVVTFSNDIANVHLEKQPSSLFIPPSSSRQQQQQQLVMMNSSPPGFALSRIRSESNIAEKAKLSMENSLKFRRMTLDDSRSEQINAINARKELTGQQRKIKKLDVNELGWLKIRMESKLNEESKPSTNWRNKNDTQIPICAAGNARRALDMWKNMEKVTNQ